MLLRDKLLARLAEDGDGSDYQRLAAEVIGIRGASPELARRLVEQALVTEDRRDAWRRAGERIVAAAPDRPGVYVLRDARGRAVYVGKAINLRRRLRAHFADRRWRHLPAVMATVCAAEWTEVGSELEALLREAETIARLLPMANVQTGEPSIETRAIPRALRRDVLLLLPSVELDSVEFVAARTTGEWLMQRTRRDGSDLYVHTGRIVRFFALPLRRGFDGPPLAPIVFSWLAARGRETTRLDPHDAGSRRNLAARLRALLKDERLFAERLDQRRG